MPREFKTVAVGGTFDELHRGHKTILLKAFEVGEHALIGLCTDRFVKKMSKEHEVAPYSYRLEDLKTFLQGKDLLGRAEIMPLNDPYGITLSKNGVEALVVSTETAPIATKINERRNATGLAPVQVVVIEMVPSENHTPISATRIRRGEMDREGHLFKKEKKTV
ncbi:pantetheine-phosphate adenylyltransferase [Candidatus Bathyarchaeota archaeon]|nr:pantetheine-phosphate adenylyltransferase [Candidatus Bathyarchaeota archaeon]